MRKDVIANRFSQIRELASDGVSSTLLAVDTDGTAVVISEILMSGLNEWSALKTLEEKAKRYGEITHRTLPQFVGYFNEELDNDAGFYLVFEDVEGVTLTHLVAEEGQQSDADVVDMVQQILGGLAVIHQSHPPIIHGRINPDTIVKTGEGRYRIKCAPLRGRLADLLSVQPESHGLSLNEESYQPIEQRKGRPIPSSDIYSLGLTAAYLISQTAPHLLPTKNMKYIYRESGIIGSIDPILDTMIVADSSQRETSAKRLLSRLGSFEPISRDDPSRGFANSATGVAAGVAAGPSSGQTEGQIAAVTIKREGSGGSVHVANPVSSRPENLLGGFLLDLWISKPWLIILIFAILSAGPLLIPLLILLFHPKSRSLLNRGYAKIRSTTITMAGGQIAVSDQMKPMNLSVISDFRIEEHTAGPRKQVEGILLEQDGSEHRFYLNNLSEADAAEIADLLQEYLRKKGREP
ncbi:MAG: hypothetical protein HN368_17840 [Spirochaetales bacterium]|jgi:serine/threonine protein kinase|nr:hypothetical protein [Spirochaetales bacterium]